MAISKKITLDDISNSIFSETYTLLPNGRTTICQLTLFEEGGFTVEGSSSCINNFDKKLGEHFSKEKAKDQIWQLLGFKLYLNNKKGN